MRVDDALGVAGGAGRVAHRRGLVLVGDGRPVDRVGRSQQGLVVVHLGAVALERSHVGGAAVVHDHQVPDGGERRHQRGQQADQGPVDEDDLVLGVVDDVGDLLGEQADVERVQHPGRARGGEVQLEVAGRVPGEGGHPTVGRDAEGVEHAAQLAGPASPLAVALALEPGGRGRHHLLAGEQLLGPVEQVGDGQGAILHEPEHVILRRWCGARGGARRLPRRSSVGPAPHGCRRRRVHGSRRRVR